MYVSKLDLFYYEVEYPWQLLKVLALLWLLLSFSFSLINSQSTIQYGAMKASLKE